MKKALLGVSAGLMSMTLMAQLPKGWHLMDKQTDGYYGISLQKAYDFVKEKKLKSNPVIVAVIDSGIDTLHEDLKPVLWKNLKEIPGNGIDDDGNGYIDDVYGWNFIGGRDGKNVEKDSYESARVYHGNRSRFTAVGFDPKSLSGADKKLYETWLRAKADVGSTTDEPTISKDQLENVRFTVMKVKEADSLVRKQLTKESYTAKELAAIQSTNNDIKTFQSFIKAVTEGSGNEDITNTELIESLTEELNYYEGELAKADAAVKGPPAYRADVVKDNYADINDRFYGNSDVMSSLSGAVHGTHVSGIIAAARNNGVGMDGVAGNVQIMTIRAVPDGDEHDKDIALAIRYAVDNGARVINMSFGKAFSPEKKWVDDAVKYAESKNVLLVHAAGNSSQNLDTTHNYPTPVFEDGTRAKNWITVGASSDTAARGNSLTASFSNYGKKEVDVFAPGVEIYATVPGGNKYRNLQGTSMASPVVAGLAAFILEYYPHLTAEQVKQVIEKSSVKPGLKAKDPGTGEYVGFDKLSTTGGLINAYEAIKLASTTKAEKGAPKSKVKKKKKQ